MTDEKKRIKILSSGPIECCGFIWGPVLTPYMESIVKIFKMISSGVNVVEVLEDGTEVKLTIENLKKDNSVKKEDPEVVVETPKPVEEPVEEVSTDEESTETKEDTVVIATVEETTKAEEPIVVTSVEETVAEVTTVEEKNYNKFNKNKHRR